MPQRVAGVLVALMGVLVVVGFLLAGADLWRAARTGPHWRRRLIGAGLLLLASLGFPACQKTAMGAEPNGGAAVPAVPGPLDNLADSEEWQRLTWTWRDAEEVATGARGDYPFNEAGKKKLLARLKAADAEVGALEAGGLLTAAEADLLRQGLALLTEGVEMKRPKETQNATFYKRMPMWPGPVKNSVDRLSARLDALEKLAAAKKLEPEVLYRALLAVEMDVQAVRDEQHWEYYHEVDKAKARALAEKAGALVEKIRARVRGEETDLKATPQWKVIEGAWREAAPLAGSEKSTCGQRVAAQEKLRAACDAARDLALAGLLTRAEADLLRTEAAQIERDMFRYRPTDWSTSCYDPAPFVPAQESLEDVLRRVPLLLRIAESGKLKPEVLRKVVAGLEQDAQVLADKGLTEDLDPTDRYEAELSRRRADWLLAEIKKSLGDAK